MQRSVRVVAAAATIVLAGAIAQGYASAGSPPAAAPCDTTSAPKAFAAPAGGTYVLYKRIDGIGRERGAALVGPGITGSLPTTCNIDELGYNSVDGYLYALHDPGRGVPPQLLRIGRADGEQIAVRTVAALDGAQRGWFADLVADVDAAGRYTVLALDSAAGTGVIQRIDPATGRAAAASTVHWTDGCAELVHNAAAQQRLRLFDGRLPRPAQLLQDWAFNPADGQFYGYAASVADPSYVGRKDPASSWTVVPGADTLIAVDPDTGVARCASLPTVQPEPSPEPSTGPSVQTSPAAGPAAGPSTDPATDPAAAAQPAADPAQEPVAGGSGWGSRNGEGPRRRARGDWRANHADHPGEHGQRGRHGWHVRRWTPGEPNGELPPPAPASQTVPAPETVRAADTVPPADTVPVRTANAGRAMSGAAFTRPNQLALYESYGRRWTLDVSRCFTADGCSPAANGDAMRHSTDAAGNPYTPAQLTVRAVTRGVNTVDLVSDQLGEQPFGLAGGQDRTFDVVPGTVTLRRAPGKAGWRLRSAQCGHDAAPVVFGGGTESVQVAVQRQAHLVCTVEGAADATAAAAQGPSGTAAAARSGTGRDGRVSVRAKGSAKGDADEGLFGGHLPLPATAATLLITVVVILLAIGLGSVMYVVLPWQLNADRAARLRAGAPRCTRCPAGSTGCRHVVPVRVPSAPRFAKWRTRG